MADPVSLPLAPAEAAPGAQPRREADGASREAMRRAARAFEAAFLAEMLKHSGLGEPPQALGGGIGEQQFAGLMRQAQARHLAEAGGIGLAEHVFEAMVARGAGDG